ncbi:Uncharacterised protein [Proteus vulgaris]|uniref:Uncharacterized protein n=1 Tax=Proteus vulgaris TaxID=585 RepID=A0A379FDD2_PROVU|nr:hypothetical protein [Proteus vulgaris]SUC17577.1 Uncharacterised protein [Proteus vulgaris]
MTVSTELSHEEYVGNGVTTDFDFRFRIFESRHLIVVVADNDGNETTLKNGTDYFIVGVGSYFGGKVVLSKPLAKDWKILLERDLPVIQETDLRNQGKFFAEVHEDAFDYLTMLIQKALGTFSLSLRKPTYLSNHYDAKGNRITNLAPPKFGSDSANKDYVDNSIKDIDSKTLRVKDKLINALPNTEQRANKILAFDDNGQPIVVLPESGSASDVLIELNSYKGANLIDNGNLVIYKKIGLFGDGGYVSSKYDVVRDVDGFWYKYLGSDLPFNYVTPDENWMNVGILNGFDLHSPENFGAIANDERFDCLPAINLAIKTGILNLYPNKTYHVSNEVIIPSYLHGSLNGATIKAIGVWDVKKAVVRFSKFSIGEKGVEVGLIENQVRGVRLNGALNIDCNNIASYGFYARLLCAESGLGDIYVYNAMKWGIVMLGCWYFTVGILHANSCAQGISLGYPTEGETSPSGGLAINAVFLPFVGAWSTAKSKGKGYDPTSDNFASNIIGAGVILGESLSSSIGVLCAEHTQGAGLVTNNAISWSLNSVYFEANSKDFAQTNEPNVSLLSSGSNREGHTLPITSLTLGARDGIFVSKNSFERIDINNIYRFDNNKTFHSDSKLNSVKVKFVNYYVLLGENYKAPNALITEPMGIDFISNNVDFNKFGDIGYFVASGAPQGMVFSLNNSPSNLVIKVDSDESPESITIIGTQFKYTLSKTRTIGKSYKISIGNISSTPDVKGSVCIRSRKGEFNYW